MEGSANFAAGESAAGQLTNRLTRDDGSGGPLNTVEARDDFFNESRAEVLGNAITAAKGKNGKARRMRRQKLGFNLYGDTDAVAALIEGLDAIGRLKPCAE